MKNNWKRLVAVGLIGMMTLSVTACGEEEVASSNSITVVETTAVTNIDPLEGGSEINGNAVALVYAGLYTLDADGNAVLDLAESVEKSDDLLTWTFTLKEDAKWSNGDPVTAYDYEYAWLRIMNIENQDGDDVSHSPADAGIKNAAAISAFEMDYTELGCKAVDDYTFVVEFEVAYPYAEQILALPNFYPVQQEFVEASGDMFGLDAEYVIANGPFVVEEFELGSTYWSYTRNPDFVGYQPVESNLDKVEFQLIQDSQQAVLAYENGDVDMLDISGEQVEEWIDDAAFTRNMDANSSYIAINCENVTSINFRNAIAHAINKEELCENVLKDGSLPEYSVMPSGLAVDESGVDFLEGSGTYQEYDTALAQEYWELAKAEMGVDTYVIDFLITDDESASTVGAFIKDQIETTLDGVTVELRTVPFKSKMDYVTTGDFDFAMLSWGGDFPDPLTYFSCYVTGYSINVSLWSNSDYDTIITDIQGGEKYTGSLEERYAAFHAAEEIFMEDASIVVLYQKAVCSLVNPKITGVENHSTGVSEVYRNVIITE